MSTRQALRCPALAAITFAGICSLPIRAAEKITYDEHVFPIFESACLNCHNPDKKKGDLDLSNYTGTLAGGSGGLIAEAGDGAGSKIYACITHTAEPFMPPKGDKIAKKDADLIRAWIDGGLLENSSSKAKKPSGPRITAIQVDPNAKPDGPPPMPSNLSLEPVVAAERGTVINDMACSPWAPLLAITGQKQILLYNTDTLQLAGIIPFPKGFPESVSFHPTGRYLLAGGGIGAKSGTTYTWDVETGKLIMEMGKEFDSVLAADLRADLGAVALGGPSRLIKLWDTQTGEQAKSIKKHTDWVTALAYSPDGVLLATGDRNGGTWVWEGYSGNEFHTLRGHDQAITDVAWRADSNILATGSEDGQVIFWEMNNGREVKKIRAHGGGTLSLDYARNGEFVTSGRDKKLKIWKADFNLKKELPAFDYMVVEVAMTQDGKRVFTADWNGKIEAWDAESFEKIGELSGNPPPITDRIAALEAELTKASTATADAAEAFDAAKRAVADARSALQNVTEKRDAKKQALARLETEMTENRLQEVEANRVETTERRKQIVLEKQAATKDLAVLEKSIKPAQEKVAKREETIAEPKATFEAARTHETKLRSELEFWRAAEVNAQLLAVTKEFESLKAQQDEDLAALESTTTQVDQFREELAAIEARKIELNAQIEALSSDVESLQEIITERRPALTELEQNAKALKARYQALRD